MRRLERQINQQILENSGHIRLAGAFAHSPCSEAGEGIVDHDFHSSCFPSEFRRTRSDPQLRDLDRARLFVTG